MGEVDGVIVGTCVTLTGVVEFTTNKPNKTITNGSIKLFRIFFKARIEIVLVKQMKNERTTT
jgi:hypothetical protein